MDYHARWSFEHRGWELKCHRCGNTFYARRRDAKYCGASCRKDVSRQATERKQKAIADIYGMIHRTRSISKQYGTSQDVLDAMILLRQSIDASLQMFSVEWDVQQLPGFKPLPSAPEAKASPASKAAKKRSTAPAMPAPAAPPQPPAASP